MKKLIVTIVLLVAASVALAGWAFSSPSVSVRDVREAESLILGQATGNHHTWGISIRGSGRIDGEATITLLLAGQPYKVEKLSGEVDFEWGGDWYSETAEVRYEPANVRSGN